jgi:hypothetical protein
LWAYETRIAWPYSWQLLAGLCTAVKRLAGAGRRWELSAPAIGSRPRAFLGPSWGPWPAPRPQSRDPLCRHPTFPAPPPLTSRTSTEKLREVATLTAFSKPPHAHQRITAPFSHRQTEYRFGITQQCNPRFQPSQPLVNNLPRTLKWRRSWSIANQPPDLSRGPASRPFRPRDIKTTSIL